MAKTKKTETMVTDPKTTMTIDGSEDEDDGSEDEDGGDEDEDDGGDDNDLEDSLENMALGE